MHIHSRALRDGVQWNRVSLLRADSSNSNSEYHFERNLRVCLAQDRVRAANSNALAALGSSGHVEHSDSIKVGPGVHFERSGGPWASPNVHFEGSAGTSASPNSHFARFGGARAGQSWATISKARHQGRHSGRSQRGRGPKHPQVQCVLAKQS